MRAITKTSRVLPITILAFIVCLGCNGDRPSTNSSDEDTSIFAKGELSPASNFTGKAWHTPLVTNDSIYNTIAGNVLFEPGARTNWHAHPTGQILIVLSGVGYHQLKGQPRETVRKGDVVKCPPNIVHWHGATQDSSMAHLYVVPKTEKGIVEWMQPVTDEEYLNPNE
jgi:quercetin dioxygenase-like cupin family protein